MSLREHLYELRHRIALALLAALLELAIQLARRHDKHKARTDLAEEVSA